ncbi:MAG: DUF2510 domain-containing protein [Coriobacteriales bacterium]|nr:DUF2510 domain-containing protein [Coriobacteriales bacterium]
MTDTTPAGWYPDPSGDTSRQRYWDGTIWTERYQSVAEAGDAANTTNTTDTASAPSPGAYAPPPNANAPAAAPYYNAGPGYAQPIPQILPQGANASLVLGIVSLAVLLFGFCIPFAGTIAIVTGIIGAYQGSKANKIQKTSQATAGFVMSVISLTLSLLWIVILIVFFGFLLASGVGLSALSYGGF